MAYGTKWRIYHTNPATGVVWQADIQLDGYAGSVTVCEPGADPIAITYSTDRAQQHWRTAPSTCTVQFVDTPDCDFSDLFGADDYTYRMLVTKDGSTVWTGFVQPDSYEYGLYVPGQSSITAVDRLKALASTTYESSPGTPYTGQARYTDILARALSAAGLDIGIETHAFWFSHNTSNALTPGTHDPLYYHTVDQGVYVDNNGDPLSCAQVLDDVLERWQLQLFQQAGRWLIYQRVRELNIAPDIFTVFQYTAGGTAEGATVRSHSYDVSAAGNTFAANTTATAIIPANQASIIYAHGSLASLWDNLDMETVNLSTGWTFGGTESTFITQVSDAHNGSSFSAQIPCKYSGTYDSTSADTYMQQVSAKPIESATDYKLRLRCYIKLPLRSDLPTGRGLNWFFQLGVGTTYFRWSDTTWQASTTVTNAIPLNLFTKGPDWFEFQTTTPVLDGLSGDITVRLYGCTEEDDFGSPTQDVVLIDDVAVEFITPSGKVLAAGIKTTTAQSGLYANDALETPTLLTGEGPLSLFAGAIHNRDSTDADTGIATDWSYDTEVSANGISIDELWTSTRLSLFQQASRRITGRLLYASTTDAAAADPLRYAYIENPNDSSLQRYFWTGTLVWRPSQPWNLLDGEFIAIAEGVGGDTVTTENLTSIPGISGSAGSGGLTTGVISVTATTGALTVQSVAELQTTDVGSLPVSVVLMSYHAGLDKGGGVFYGDPNDTTTTLDGGTVFSDPSGKRWRRVDAYSGGVPYSPLWFGAKFDGTTDDAAAIQACLDAVPYSGTVQMPPGITRVGTTLTLNGRPVTVQGAGESYWADTGYSGEDGYSFPDYPDYGGTVIRSGLALAGPMWSIYDTDTLSERRNAVRLRGLHMVGNRITQNGGTATDSYGVRITGGWFVKLEHCAINGFTDSGVYIERSTVSGTFVSDLVHVIACHISDNGAWGIEHNQHDSWITRCRISHNVTGGVLLGGTQVTVHDNWIDLNTGHGLRANGSQGHIITGNRIDQNDRCGLFLGDGTTAVTDYIVTGNFVTGNGRDGTAPLEQRAGCWIYGGMNWHVTGNSFVENNLTGLDDEGATVHRQTYGLYLSDGWYGHRITDNLYRGNLFGRTNLLTKNPDGVYNVLGYGIMQRANDASTALQVLIDAVDEGSTLYFPQGNYLLGTTLTVSKALRFLGQSVDDLDANRGSYIQAADALDAPCIQVNAGGVVIERLNFQGSLLAPSSNAQGVQFTSGIGGRVDRCIMSSFVGPAVYVQTGASNVQLHDSVFINCSTNGVTVSGNNTRISGCELRQNDQYGLYVLNAFDVRVTDCFIYANLWDGLIVQGGGRAIVVGNTCRANGQAGINVRSGTRHIVHANTCHANGTDTTGAASIERAGIYLTEGDRVSVCYNYCGTDTGASNQLYGITFGSGLTSAQVLGNTFEANATAPYLFNSTASAGLDIDLSGRTTIDFTSISAGATSTQAITLDGVLAGDAVMFGPPSNWPTGLVYYGYCSAADTVTLIVYNPGGSAVDPSSGEWQVLVSRRGGVATAEPPASSLTLSVLHTYANPNLLLNA